MYMPPYDQCSFLQCLSTFYHSVCQILKYGLSRKVLIWTFWVILGPFCPNSRERDFFLKNGVCQFSMFIAPNLIQNIRKNRLMVLRAFSQTLHFSSPLQWSSRVEKSVRPSPQMSYFLSLVFSDFLHGVGQSKMIKSSEARFSKKCLVFPKF